MAKFKIEIVKKQHGFWGMCELNRRNLTIEAQTQEEATMTASLRVMSDPKFGSKSLRNGDRVSWFVA